MGFPVFFNGVEPGREEIDNSQFNKNLFLIAQLDLLEIRPIPVSGYTIFIKTSHYNYISLFETLSIVDKYHRFGQPVPTWYLEMNRYPTTICWNDLFHLNGEKVIPLSQFFEVLSKKIKAIHYLIEKNPESLDRRWSSLFEGLFTDINNILGTYLDLQR